MHTCHRLTADLGLHKGAAVKRGVQHGHCLARGDPRIAARVARDAPGGAGQAGQGGRINHLNLAVRRDIKAQCKGGPIRADTIVKAGRPTACARKSAPCPAFEICLQRRGAKIGVEIAVACPAVALGQVHLDLGRRREGPPDMAGAWGQAGLYLRHSAWRQAYLALHPANHWQRRDLVDINHQAAILP